MIGVPGREEVRVAAREIGFEACGIASLEPSRWSEALDRWLGAGYGGDMRYLHRQARKRKTPGEIVPEAKVAVVVLENYLTPDSIESGPGLKIARYAGGADYHQTMAARLERLAGWLLERGARVARHYLDAGPVPERELAVRAGLGWIGKNTMLIQPRAGSYFFIGTILTDLALEPDRPFATDHCGSCTACLDACPTGAFVEPRVLDATRCISYLTIEQKGPVPEAVLPQLQGWASGCDICNEVCPWNVRFARPGSHPEYAPRPDPDREDPEYFERLDDLEFTLRFADSPLARPGLAGLRRNWRTATAAGS